MLDEANNLYITNCLLEKHIKQTVIDRGDDPEVVLKGNYIQGLDMCTNTRLRQTTDYK